jgi:hypothetical protein
MIHHLSIAAENPHRVAEVLAELWGGVAYPFPPHPGSYITMAKDKEGTAIEVYPLGTELVPGDGEEQAQFCRGTSSQFSATHVNISVSTSLEKIQQIGAREGWRVLLCNRGPFEVIEFWLENHLMIEVLTPELLLQYIEFAKPENWEAFLNDPGISVTAHQIHATSELEVVS